MRKRNRSDREKYRGHRDTAVARGINWEFTFEQWLAVWKESGKYHLRGNKPGEYVMGRYGDVGPYSRANVYICEFTQNLRDMAFNKRAAVGPTLPYEMEKINGLNKVKSAATRGRGRGWHFDPRRKTNPYKAKFRARTIGCFSSAEDAHRAYLQAVNTYEKANSCF